MDNKEFTKALSRTKLMTVREAVGARMGKGEGKRFLLLGDDKSLKEFEKQFHQDRGI